MSAMGWAAALAVVVGCTAWIADSAAVQLVQHAIGALP